MRENHKVLFTPMTVGSVNIKNRFVHAPMDGTEPIDWMVSYKFNDKSRTYLVDKAKNGVGLIIPGIVCVYSLVKPGWLYEHEDIFMGPVKELMDEIHSYGSKLFLQIGAGFGRITPIPAEMKAMITGGELSENRFLVAPSDGLPNVWAPEIKHRAMTEKEIQDIIDAYIKSAVLCKKAGIDGIEIHAIHEGYLLDQFTISNTNHRTDNYGGSLENRFRFVTEIIKGIKEVCGDDYPVIVRYSVTSKMRGFNKGAIPGEKFEEFGRDYDESIKAAQILEAAGADALDADNGSYDSWFWAHPPMYMPLACNLDDAAFIKQHVNIPVFCAGRMEDPDTSAKAIEDGLIDGVAIGRQFLTDPEYCTKVENGEVDDIRPCIACHNGCFAISQEKGGAGMNPWGNAHCALNPCALEEDNKKLNPISEPKNIAIIGGGIAGMEVARVATLRGHHATIFEQSDELGGVFIAATAPDFKEKDKMLLNWYIKQMKDLNIDIHFNTKVTQAELAALDADEIIVATGSSPRTLNIAGGDSEKVLEAIEYYRADKPLEDHVAVIGGGLTGCEIAYDVALKGKKVSIIEMQDDILNVPHLSAANSNMLRELIRYYDIPVFTSAKTVEVNDQGVVIEQNGVTTLVEAGTVVTSIGYNPTTELFHESEEHSHIVGDASKVGNLLNAIWGAYDLANSL